MKRTILLWKGEGMDVAGMRGYHGKNEGFLVKDIAVCIESGKPAAAVSFEITPFSRGSAMRLVCEERLNQLPLRAWRTEEIGKTDDYGHFNVRLSFLLVKSEKHCVTAMKRFSELMAALGVKPSDFSCGQPRIPRFDPPVITQETYVRQGHGVVPLGVYLAEKYLPVIR